MTVPSPRHHPSRAWHTLVASGQSSASMRACVAAAARLADRLSAHVIGPNLEVATSTAEAARNAWAQIALTAYEELRQARAYAYLDAPARLRCIADPDLMRAWLTRRSDLPGFAHHTVAQTWAITDDEFHWEADDIAARLSTLVDQAQKAGVYGVPGYTISLRHITSGDPGDPIEHQVTLHTAAGAFLAGHPMPTDHLVDDLTGVDGAVAALVNTGAVVNELLIDEQRIIIDSLDASPHAEPTPPSAPPARGFTPLDLTTPTAVSSVDPPATAHPQPGHHR